MRHARDAPARESALSPPRPDLQTMGATSLKSWCSFAVSDVMPPLHFACHTAFMLIAGVNTSAEGKVEIKIV